MRPRDLVLILLIACTWPLERAAGGVITNGDFETGDLTGWTVSAFGGDPLISVLDVGGNHVANFPTGDFATGPFIQILEQTFTIDPAEPFLTFDFALPDLQPDPTGKGSSPFLDAFVVSGSAGMSNFEFLLIDANGALPDPFGTAPGDVFLGPPTDTTMDFSLSVDLSSLFGAGLWGGFTISYSVVNEDDSSMFSSLYVDNVAMAKEPIPAPGGLLLVAVGLVSCNSLSRRRSRA